MKTTTVFSIILGVSFTFFSHLSSVAQNSRWLTKVGLYLVEGTSIKSVHGLIAAAWVSAQWLLQPTR